VTATTEVHLTSRRSARWQQGLVAFALLGTIVGVGFAITTDPQWWVILVWTVAAVVLLVILIGLWFAARESARASQWLHESGEVTRADVLDGERVDEDDEVRYVLTLEIRPVGHDAFTVTHRCGHERCRAAAEAAPTAITALVDASRRTWAVVHG
jgi:ABC-type nickel/cobalt efflux system permease component RcnA